jgi:hypothetical protein
MAHPASSCHSPNQQSCVIYSRYMRKFIAKLLIVIVSSLLGLIVFALFASLLGLIPKIWWGGEADISFGVNIDILVILSIPIYLLITAILKLCHRIVTHQCIAIVASLIGIFILPAEMLFTRFITLIPGWSLLAPWHAMFIGFSISCLIITILITLLAVPILK